MQQPISDEGTYRARNEPTTPEAISEVYVATANPAPQVVYVTYTTEPPPLYASRTIAYSTASVIDDDASQAGLWCAIIGFIFSWIPIVGFVTFCVNCNAPAGSKRALFSNLACFVATMVVFLNIFLWPIMYRR